MSSFSTVIYHGDALAAYGFGEGHPFGFDRLGAFRREFLKRGLQEKVEISPPFSCKKEKLLLFHEKSYIENVLQQCARGEGYLDYGDTPAIKGGFEAASTVVGTLLDGLRRVMEGKNSRAFIPIAGLHHARRERAGGFCIFNDLGVAIESALKEWNLTRIAYVDIDAHHGDGIYYSFSSNPSVWIADIHEDGRFLYPGTGFSGESGEGEAKGTKLNLPLPPYSTDAHWLQAWHKALAHIKKGEPEILFLQAGADGLAGDPITHLQLTEKCHRKAAEDLAALADSLGHGRVVATGGGGYDRDNLAKAWCEVVEGLIGDGKHPGH